MVCKASHLSKVKEAREGVAQSRPWGREFRERTPNVKAQAEGRPRCWLKNSRKQKQRVRSRGAEEAKRKMLRGRCQEDFARMF